MADEKGYAHLGGGAILPTPTLDYYEFSGWCDNAELNGEAVNVKGKASTLFAKYTPINYTISYVLGNGAWNEGYVAPASYNYESDEIELPTAANLSINDGAFLGWYDNVDGKGTAITSIPAQSHGDVKLYAVWKMNGPVDVELSSYDETVISKYNPNLFVSDKFSSGKFNINGQIYEAGVNAFTSISSAISSASENDVIYVFSGAYDESVNINVSGLTLIGANADVDPNTGTRENESSIKRLTVSANDVTFNGFYFVDRLEKEVESILVSPSVSNCTLGYNIIANQTKFNTNAVGLIKVTGPAGQEVNNLTIQNFKVEKGSLRPTLIHAYGVNNLTVKDSVFLGSATAYLYTDSVKIVNSGNYGIKGNVVFTGNTFKDYGQYLLWFAGCASVNINVSSNKFINCGQSSTNHGAVYVASAASSFTEAVVTVCNNVVDNSYMLLRVAAVSKFTADNFVAEVHYNSVLNSSANVHIKNESSGIVNAENNYYDTVPTADKFTGVVAWNPYLTEDPNK